MSQEREERRKPRFHTYSAGKRPRATPETAGLAVGYFGASTGAAAALIAAAERPDEVGAVVSRGGRPDLAGAALARVRAPTLLIVGGADQQVLELNRRSRELIESECRLEVVPGRLTCSRSRARSRR